MAACCETIFACSAIALTNLTTPKKSKKAAKTKEVSLSKPLEPAVVPQRVDDADVKAWFDKFHETASEGRVGSAPQPLRKQYTSKKPPTWADFKSSDGYQLVLHYAKSK